MYDGSRQHALFAHKFTGKERDAESGLDNFEARYLGSSLGRFMSPDPMGGHLQDSQTLNRYAYVRNNPLSLTDPTGLDFYLSWRVATPLLWVALVFLLAARHLLLTFRTVSPNYKNPGGWRWGWEGARICAVGFDSGGAASLVIFKGAGFDLSVLSKL